MAKILLNLLINMYNFFEIRKKTLKLAFMQKLDDNHNDEPVKWVS